MFYLSYQGTNLLDAYVEGTVRANWLYFIFGFIQSNINGGIRVGNTGGYYNYLNLQSKGNGLNYFVSSSSNPQSVDAFLQFNENNTTYFWGIIL